MARRNFLDDPLFAHDPPRQGVSTSGARSALMALTLVGAAGALAYAFAPRRGGRDAPPTEAFPGMATGGAGPEVERSLTIEGASLEALAERWREPETLKAIMAPFADIEFLGPDWTRWNAGPAGDWTMRCEAEPLAPKETVRWIATEPDAPLKAFSVRFTRARPSGEAVATLHLKVDPGGGALGRSIARLGGDLLPGAVATKALHYFKALVQTGEIPTTKGQPAARRVEP